MDANVLKTLSEEIKKSVIIDDELYVKYDVKRGLRELSGKGVLAGLTEISEVRGTEVRDGEVCPIEGQLIYRGIDINKIIDGFTSEERFGFEETIYLLLMGKLPDEEQLKMFTGVLREYRSLPDGFIRDIMIKSPSQDVMNMMSRSVLSLYSYDKNPDDTSLENVLRQSLYCMQNTGAAITPRLPITWFHLQVQIPIQQLHPPSYVYFYIRQNYLPPSLQWPGYRDGALTAWKRSPTGEK